MGEYCTINDLSRALSQSLTTANPSPLSAVPAKLSAIGKQLKVDLVTTDDANWYIRAASSQIDSAMSQQYVTPLDETPSLERELTVDVDEYSSADGIVVLDDAIQLNPGDVLYFSDGTHTERTYVSEVDDDNVTVTLTAPLNTLFTAGTRVLRLSYPDPITYICARLAAAMIYDKYATAQSEPGKTEFGKALREDAFAELNNIRDGRTILHGIERRGWRFANPNLVDRYTVKGPVEQISTGADVRKG